MENKYNLILDGRLDEPAWETAKAYTDFRGLGVSGGHLAQNQTVMKFLSCEDRVYIGVKCFSADMDYVVQTYAKCSIYGTERIELLLAPSGKSMDFYQFLLTIGGQQETYYRIEEGRTVPIPYNPDWNYAIYTGEDFWSAEIEIPFTAFFMTPSESWSNEWAINVMRGNICPNGLVHNSMGSCYMNFWEMDHFCLVDGFDKRPKEDDLCINEAIVNLTEECADGYRGTMAITTTNSDSGAYVFSSNHGDSLELELEVGSNAFSVPCYFPELGRYKISLEMKRVSDGKIFKIYYPVTATYEPIKLKFTLPEYRCNFYPGQDYSKIVGKVIASKPVTLKLEGPGIETTVQTPDAEGNFTFETPNFQEGEAWLTATIDGYETKQKIRRLAPTGKMMAWISGGNLVVNGKPVLRRNLYGPHYRGGTAFDRRYDADDLHETKYIIAQTDWIQPCELVRGSEASGGEATQDVMPSPEMLKAVDERIEKNKDNDFVYYYPSDEPECRGLSPVYMKHYCDYIADKDPYHVIMMASRSPDTLVDCVDWVETHPYINPHVRADGTRFYERSLHSIGNFVDKMAKMNRPDKCIGFLPTCYAFPGPSGSDYPTLDEYIVHTWAAMIRGGKTIWPYAYHDVNDRASLYEGTRYIFSSFEALEDIVLFGKRTTLAKSVEREAVLYEHNDEKMFVIVNLTQEPQTVTLEGLRGTYYEFRGSRIFTDNTFTLKPLETVIGTSVVKGADLPTYAETAALIDKLEYERTHRGSLLFNRFMDIALTSSGTRGMVKAKLFDGVQDNMAGFVNKKDENFLELNLTKVKPSFNKVVIHGYGLDEMEIKVKTGETLSVPAVTDTKVEEFSKTFLLAETVSPDALRLEFGGKTVELYEIEAF